MAAYQALVVILAWRRSPVSVGQAGRHGTRQGKSEIDRPCGPALTCMGERKIGQEQVGTGAESKETRAPRKGMRLRSGLFFLWRIGMKEEKPWGTMKQLSLHEFAPPNAGYCDTTLFAYPFLKGAPERRNILQSSFKKHESESAARSPSRSFFGFHYKG